VVTPRKPRVLVTGYNAFDVTVPFGGVPVADAKHAVPEILLGGGGPGATAAVALARLGAAVQLVTPLADDLPGRLQEQELLAAGVDLSHCPRREGHRSARAVILADAGKQHRTIFWSRGELPLIAPEEVSGQWLQGADLFYTDGHEPLASVKLGRRAREMGMPVVMDAGSVRQGSAELVALCSDVISSETFAPDLTGCQDPLEALEGLSRRGPARVAMTFGAGGMLTLVDGKPLAVPAFDLPVVDTTGAGDVFHAGYAYALATGLGLVDSLRFGAAAAGLKCRDWGGRRGLPDLAEVQSVLAQGKPRPLDPRLAAYPSS
jgi:sulfofructose kinase